MLSKHKGGTVLSMAVNNSASACLRMNLITKTTHLETMGSGIRTCTMAGNVRLAALTRDPAPGPSRSSQGRPHDIRVECY